MAFVIKDAFVEIDGVDLSCHVSSVEVELTKDEVKADTMCGQATLHGLDTSMITVNFLQSFAAGEVDATLFPLFNDETEFTVKIRPHGGNPANPAPVSTTNPQYNADCKLFSYSALSGGVGDASETSVKFPVQGAITRVTA